MKKQRIRLLCLDIDGTLLDSQHRLPSQNKEAVKKAIQAGVTVCLMSARPPSAVVPILRALEMEHNMACYNGGLILHKDKTMCEERIPVLTGAQIVQEAQHCGVHLSAYRNWDWFIEKNDRWSVQESQITGIFPITAPLIKTVSQWEDGAHKFLCMGKPHQIDAVYAGLRERRLPVQMVRSKDTYLEILPLRAEKGIALQSTCQMLHIAKEQSMAIGDHDNDCDMLREAGWGVAMGNGSEAAKTAADVCTRTNDEAGVAFAIDTWILKSREERA